MGRTLVLALVTTWLFAPAAGAGVPDPRRASSTPDIPDPLRSGCGVSGQLVNNPTCGAKLFRFLADGNQDTITIDVTLRTAFDLPVPACATTATLKNDNGTAVSFCDCDTSTPLTQTGVTDIDGVVRFLFDGALGGRGTLECSIVENCTGALIHVSDCPFEFTSPDLNASCDSGFPSTDIVDIGAWAGGIGPYNCTTGPTGTSFYSDFDGDGAVDIIDLGALAAGLDKGC